MFLDPFGAREAGHAKERGRRSAVSQRRRHRCNALVDFLPDAFDRQAVHAGRMILGVGRDGVAGVADLAHAFRIGLGLTADQEEGRLHALGGQDFQNPVAVASAAARRRRSAPPRHPRAAAFRHIAWCRCGGCSRGSTTRVREVPSASGCPGQSAANAAGEVMQVNSPRQTAIRRRPPPNTLPIMQHRDSHLRESLPPRRERGLNCPTFSHNSSLGDAGAAGCRAEPAPDEPRDSDCP